jgi:hypothetical protein
MKKDKLLLVVAFVFFTLLAIAKGFGVGALDWPWLLPGGLAALVLAEMV